MSDWVRNFSPWVSSVMEAANEMKFGTKFRGWGWCLNVEYTHIAEKAHSTMRMHQWRANLKSQFHCKISNVFQIPIPKILIQIPNAYPKSQSQNSKSELNLKAQSFLKTIKQHDCVKYRMLLANVIALFSNVMKLSLCHLTALKHFEAQQQSLHSCGSHLVGFCVCSSSSLSSPTLNSLSTLADVARILAMTFSVGKLSVLAQ